MQLPTLPSRETCTLCPLHKTAASVGVRSLWLDNSQAPSPGTNAIIMIGRNPGARENEAGLPFVGRSGKVLREGYLAASETHPSLLTLGSVYLFNTVRCFTPADAEPNWKQHVVPCYQHTLTDLKEVLKCHSEPPTSSPAPATPVTGPSGPPADVESARSSGTRPASASGPSRFAIVCLGAQASQAFLSLALGEKSPKSQSEAFKNNGREVRWGSNELYLLHTYHPAYYLRNPNCGQAIQDHVTMLIDWLMGKVIAPSQPLIIEPRGPQT